MRILFFLICSVLLSAQKVELIELDQNIKDKRELTRSLTFTDNRPDKYIGLLDYKGETTEIKFSDGNLRDLFENWFSEDNKVKGNNDITLILEELKIYQEQDPGQKEAFGKAKIKISSFLKRNDKYYFINRFENVIVSDLKSSDKAARFLASQISAILAQFIKTSYSNPVSGIMIPENELNNYSPFLNKNYKAFNEVILQDGVYKSFKNFYNQKPEAGHSIVKNKKGKLVSVKFNDFSVPLSEVFCYVDSGKAYIAIPRGFVEMSKGNKGFYIISSRAQLSIQKMTGGMMVGALAGGVVGALAGSVIDPGTSHTAIITGVKTTTSSKVYLDSLTGAYIFEK
ncbi:hypothetical protein ACM46_03675 [Chryseobacterium angstadtii]|uniref:Glycine zipper domain-containing protein n=1 Tax=Chryseobacterium angstadtii TaxID=558151 RepID=A0A0J7IKU0_9FLAO|nr:hypothetical protein [Chryseobacterium angstadtii]KMQ66631.1 hypothetical protein ACM46_03675 [Chryseobacterium angstadtii]